MIIGLTGPMASGKNTIFKVLEKKGFQCITMSDVIRAVMEKQGLSAERSVMQDFSNSVKAKEGAGAWAKRCLDYMKEKGGKKWVIDGIRNPAEIAEFSKDPVFVLIAVLTPEKEIIRRIQARKRDIDPSDAAEIRQRLLRDWGLGEPPLGQQVGLCVRMADYFFVNAGSIDTIGKEFLNLYDRIMSEKNPAFNH